MRDNPEKLRKLQGLEDQAIKVEKATEDSCYRTASDTAEALNIVVLALVLYARIRLFELSCKVREGKL